MLARADALGVEIERALVLAQELAPGDMGASWLAGSERSLTRLGWDWVFPELQFSFVAFGQPVAGRNEHGLFGTRAELAAHEATYRQRFAVEGLDNWEDPEGAYAVLLYEDVGAVWTRSRFSSRS